MAPMPTFEQVKADFERGVRAAEERFTRHAASAAHQAPAQRPATMAPATAGAATPGGTMSLTLTGIVGDIKSAVDNADQWVKEITDTHLPNVLALAAKYENSPIVQALETALLPPEVEAGIAGTIRELAKLYPAQGAQQAPAQGTAAAQGSGTAQGAQAAGQGAQGAPAGQ